ncbi:MAG: HAD-IIIA family hydrolase [Actinobacteria bacterium]|nr:MAG: HAD-IIIA family hydrolase [Actinomycetota bacterium]
MADARLTHAERPRAVLFDVDFTLCRPGPELSPERYARIAERHGVALDVSTYEAAREAAVLNLKRHPEFLHDDAIWHRFTEEIFIGMGGPDAIASECAAEIERGWENSANFELYEDVLPVLDDLRAHGLKLGLVSNGIRDLTEFVSHHRLDVDAVVDSRTHGYVKPHPTIFQAALERLGVLAQEAVMVGDSVEEDVDGARALGMRAILVDREDRYPEVDGRLTDLLALPSALGLSRP